MIFCLLIFFILPIIIGLSSKIIFGNNQLNGLSFYFVFGFIILVVEFSVTCYPAIFLQIPFHKTVNKTLMIYTVQTVICIIVLIYHKAKLFKITEEVKNGINDILHKNPLFWIMICIIAYQILRVFFFEKYEYRDCKTYNALINDIVHSDIIYGKNDVNGKNLENVLETNLKYLLSPWYPFIGMISKVSGLHTVIVSNTLMSSFVILLSYLVMWNLSERLFDNKKQRYLFMIFVVLLLEMTFSSDFSLIFLWGSYWGKNLVANIVIPLVFIVMFTEVEDRCDTIKYSFLMFIITLFGCTVSTMSVMVLPIEIVFITFIQLVKERKIQYKYIIRAFFGLVPLLTYLACFLYLRK